MLFIKTVSLEFILFLFVVVHCKGPPELIGTVKPLYIEREGKTVKLRCKYSGTKDSQDNRTLTAWQKLPEQYITSQYDKRFTTRNGRYLKIKRLRLEDQGTYVCTAFNSFGKIQREIRLVVQASNSSKRTSHEKEANTKPIPSTSVLSSSAREPPLITSTTKRPTRKGSRGPSIPLLDDNQPRFRNPSKNSHRFLEYIEGVQVKLKCHANGAQPLNVTWLKNGKPLRRAGQTLLKSKGWVLNFAALSYNDAGTYTCTARNAFGSIMRTFVIKVVDRRRPPLKESQPVILENVLKNKTAITGEDVTFVCSAESKSHPEFHFLKWKSSKNVSNGSDPFEFVDFTKSKFREIRKVNKQHMGNRQVYTHRLIVRNVTLADATKYTCVVGNSAGYVSKHAFLTVLSWEGEPTFSDPSMLKRAFRAWPASHSIRLKCLATGAPPLKYTWLKDGKKMPRRMMDPHLNSSIWYLKLKDLVPNDSGKYTCIVSNPYGSINHTYTLQVVGKPRSRPILEIDLPKNTTVQLGDNATMTCIVLVSGTLPDFRWLKWDKSITSMPKIGDDLENGLYKLIDDHYYNTIQVKENYGVELRITNVTEDDLGLYTCFVSNHIGKDYNSAFLSKYVKPTVPVRVTAPTLGITAIKTTKDSTGTASVEGFHARKEPQPKRDRIRLILFVTIPLCGAVIITAFLAWYYWQVRKIKKSASPRAVAMDTIEQSGHTRKKPRNEYVFLPQY